MSAADPQVAWVPLLQGVPAEEEALFADSDGLLARRAAAKRAKVVGALAPLLGRALQPGERVRHATTGYRYYLGEYYFGGWAAYHHNRVALILTDRRLFLVQLRRRGGAGDIKNQVRLEEVRGVKSPFIGAWRIDLADGTKLSLVGMPRRERKRLAALLPQAPRGAAAPRPAGQSPSVEHLCPACLTVVPGPVGTSLSCPEPSCRIPFRDPRKAARLSAVVPGLGDLYLRHHFFGALEFLGSMAMLGVAILFLFALAGGAEGGSGAAIGAGIGLLLIAVPRVIDHRITLHMGRKGLVPLASAPAPGAQARNLPSFPRWSPLLFAAGLALAGGIAWVGGVEIRSDAALREATDLAGQGRHDEAMASFQGLAAAGRVDEARRVRFALALLESGDLSGAEVVQAGFSGGAIDASLAKRWNQAYEAQQAAFTAYREGLRALAQGDETQAWPKLDRAIANLGKARRPHFPATRGEARLHLAAAFLSPPADPVRLERAEALLAAAADGPAPEASAVKAAIRALRGDLAGARAEAAGLSVKALPRDFQLVVLEARRASAAGAAERAAVARETEGFDLEALDEEDAARVEALRAP